MNLGSGNRSEISNIPNLSDRKVGVLYCWYIPPVKLTMRLRVKLQDCEEVDDYVCVRCVRERDERWHCASAATFEKRNETERERVGKRRDAGAKSGKRSIETVCAVLWLLSSGRRRRSGESRRWSVSQSSVIGARNCREDVSRVLCAHLLLETVVFTKVIVSFGQTNL